jgi:epsin
MDMLDKRLNDKGKNWRHVLKSLKVLDYCLHEGSELVVTWARQNVYIIKTLREFQYIDEEGKDVGQNGNRQLHLCLASSLTPSTVRVSAKELTSLILDEDRLRSERSDRKLWKSRVHGIDEYGPSAIAGPPIDRPQNSRRKNPRTDEEDAEYRLAIEASKHEAEEEKKRREKNKTVEDDDDLAKAIKLSKEEEELRRRELEDQNATSLFDDTPTPAPVPAQPQATGWNQGYQQQGAVDWFGNPIQQPMSTGFLNNQYSQPQQPQQTGYQNGYTNGFGPQPTGFDQFQQQQPAFMQPQPTIQPQQTAFSNNPYGQHQQQQQTSDVFGQQPPQQSFPQAGSHNPWATNSQQQADSLKPMPTGSNNPFAQRPQPVQQKTSPPALNKLYEQQTATQYSQPTQPNPIINFQAPQPQSQSPQPTAINSKPMNPQHARLNALLASGEGQDTFGNVGDLRIPAQHTAPGTFVNSAGGGMDRLRAAQTGTNPFFQQQFTGTPPQGGYQAQLPAQTGPGAFGGAFGQPNNNPFGARPAQQQGGSLIDF